ncbi:hypothetical protein DPPLL_37430 [Desulfofustis limnaeus]|jgi:hypothetical protein|uniref:Uncharacterized protein n=1 Tax=Desulfofustis limnaeus TaxID=2740163 RepID=A0ABM7WEH8_9BACT|nr:hypothetical protein DPPLL_37430 [Desulfofustis limnaeus]
MNVNSFLGLDFKKILRKNDREDNRNRIVPFERTTNGGCRRLCDEAESLQESSRLTFEPENAAGMCGGNSRFALAMRVSF